jgi:hypothetical protein
MTPEKSTSHQTDKVSAASPSKQPRRPKRNLTPEGRKRLRENALKYKPWQHSTGPRTPEGKAKVAENGRYRQRGGKSKRAIKKEIQEALMTTDQLAELTRLLEDSGPTQAAE